MDNLTHSFIGYTLGAAGLWLTRHRHPHRGHHDPSRDIRWRRAILVASVVGNNLPDLDLLLAPLIRFNSYPTIAQLLHHRGHSHTVLFAPLLALLGAALVRWGFWRAREHRPGFGLLWAICTAGALTHLLADSWNEYGVHPFWPLDPRWYYGDMVFIVEPLLWASLGAFTAWHLRNRLLRGFLLAPQVVVVWLCWYLAAIPPGVAAALSGLTLLGHLLQWKFRSVGLALASAALLLGSLGLARTIARDEIRGAFGGGPQGGERIQQLITSPSPANPFCWRTLVVSVDEARDTYRVSIGGVSLWPAMLAARDCAFRIPSEEVRTAPTHPSPLEAAETPGARVHWYGEYTSSWSEWKRLAQDDCAVAAFLRFARAPFRVQRGTDAIFGDMRYDREPGLGFAEFVDHPGKCPEFTPSWGQPIFQ